MSDIYELKTIRFFNLFHIFKINKLMKYFFLPCLVLTLAALLVKDAEVKADLCGYLVVFCILSFLITIARVYSNPKCLDVRKNSVEFSISTTFLMLLTHRRINRFYNDRYKVYNIKEIKYHQTALEKKFNVGSISFKGMVLVTNSDGEIQREEPDGYEIVRGIKDFSDMIIWMESYVEICDAEFFYN